ncbi:hypothetical protein GCM10010924_47090 [Rhizobium wenxiniae]|nr:hypothetical protein GCM10010924_47090 [Rhizobium wenxiniae]
MDGEGKRKQAHAKEIERKDAMEARHGPNGCSGRCPTASGKW